jgi:hypothetical protein
VVGDRLDTDIEGANAVGCPSLLVLTGVTTPGELIRARPQHRPTYVGRDLGTLLTAHPGVEQGVEQAGETFACGPWRVRAGGETLELGAAGEVHPENPDPVDALRALATASWAVADRDAPISQTSAADRVSAECLAQLRLT